MSRNPFSSWVIAIVSHMVCFVPLAGCRFSNCLWLCASLPSSAYVSALVIGDSMLQLLICSWKLDHFEKFSFLAWMLWWIWGDLDLLATAFFSSVSQWGSKLYKIVGNSLLYFGVIEPIWSMNQWLRCWGKKHDGLIFSFTYCDD